MWAAAREVKARWGDTAAWRENQERQQSGEETAWGAAQAEAEELIDVDRREDLKSL